MDKEYPAMEICSKCHKLVLRVYQLGKCRSCLAEEMMEPRTTLNKYRDPKVEYKDGRNMD